MRKAVLFLSVAFIGLSPVFLIPSFAHAVDPSVPAAQSASPNASAAAAFSDAQRAEIENIIKEYLTTKHPEVMAQGLQTLQQREQENADAKTKSEVTNAKDRIFNDAMSPVVGNAKGNVTMVEFYDYQCGYCKMSEDAVERIIKEDKNLKVIYKDFPILGPASAEAAKASLASVKQGKFEIFHNALMAKKDHLSSDLIYQTAKDVGLDVEKLKKDMTDPAINDAITANLKLGQDIGVRGTPMFIINDTVFPGAMQYDQMKQSISDVRAADKKS